MTEEAKPAPAAYNNDESAAAAILQQMDAPAKEPEKKTQAAEPEEAKEPQQEAQPETEAEPEDGPVEITDEQANKLRRRFKIKNENGEDVEVVKTIKELESERMMQADYQRKTAEIARQREKVQEEARQAVEQERQRFLANAQGVQRALLMTAATEFQQEGVNLFDQTALQGYMGKLAQDDPAKYIRMQNRLNELNQSLNHVTQTITAETHKQRRERFETIKKASADAWDELGKLPGWSQEKYEALLTVGYEYGFRPEEIANPVRQDGTIPEGYLPAVDPRFMKLLNDAQAYRQQQKQQPVVDKKVAAAPKVMKPGAPAKADNKQRQDEQMARLKKTGRIDEAASLIQGMMR